MSKKSIYIALNPPFTVDKHLDGGSSERPTGSFSILKNYIPEHDILRARKGVTKFTHTPESTVTANDFSGDANCLSWYKMEEYTGNVFADDQGSNPVTGGATSNSAYITQDTTNTIAPGLTGSLSLDNAATLRSAFGTLAFTDMGTSIPGSVGVDTTMSVLGWVRWGAHHGAAQGIIGRWNTHSAARSWLIYIHTAATNLRFLLRDTANISYTISADFSLTTGNWYHFKGTFSSSTLTATLRVCNSSGTTVYTGNATLANDLDTHDQALNIGTFDTTAARSFDGNLQELVIFDDVVSDAEQDQIIAGTYSP